MPLQCRLTSPGLAELCEYHKVKEWAQQGGLFGSFFGQGRRGHTHTQELSQFAAIC